MGKSYRSEKYAGDGFVRKSSKPKHHNHSHIVRARAVKQFELLAEISSERVKNRENDDSLDNY